MEAHDLPYAAQERALTRRVNRAADFVGALRSDEVELQRFQDCYVRALYNHPALRPIRHVLNYEQFLELFEKHSGKALRQEGTPHDDADDFLRTLGYEPSYRLQPQNEGQLVDRLRRTEGGVLAFFAFHSSAHATLIQGAFKENGSWKFLVTDSNAPAPMTYTFEQLQALQLSVSSIERGRSFHIFTPFDIQAAENAAALSRSGAPTPR